MSKKSMEEISDKEIAEYFTLQVMAADILARKLGYPDSKEMARDRMRPELNFPHKLVLARPL